VVTGALTYEMGRDIFEVDIPAHLIPLGHRHNWGGFCGGTQVTNLLNHGTVYSPSWHRPVKIRFTLNCHCLAEHYSLGAIYRHMKGMEAWTFLPMSLETP
jgi:hypothetical protein